MLTEITQGHGSAMGIGSFDSSQCKGALVRDPGPGGAAGGSSWGHGIGRQLSHIAVLPIRGFPGGGA